MPSNYFNNFLYGIMAIIFAAFIYTGVSLIVQSNVIYKQSAIQSELVTQKVLDPTFQKQSVAISTPAYNVVRDGYSQALSFFILAFGVLLVAFLLPRIQNFSIGPGGVAVSLKDLQQNVDTLIKQANIIQEDSVGKGGRKIVEKASVLANTHKKTIVEEYPDDPQKGKWGKIPENNFRKLSANIGPSRWPGFYSVDLKVESTNPLLPLAGVVKFHLHDTFNNPDPVIAVRDGIAALLLIKVYGGFTAGAEADDGKTKLELDLAELPDVPQNFKER
jgi:hypothetical protein